MPGTREREIASHRIEPGGAYHRSPLPSATYFLLVSPLSRSCIFPRKLESSLYCFVSSCGLRSRPAIRCSMVGHRPLCSLCLRAVSADVAVTWVVNIGSGVPWSFCFFVRVHENGVTGGGGGGMSPGSATGGGGLDS